MIRRRSAVPVITLMATLCLLGLARAAPVAAATNAPAWHPAAEVPGTAALNTGGYAYVQSVSCASADNCSAGGYYLAGGYQAFVVSEVNGTWQTAVEVPGTAALNVGATAGIGSVSCLSAGNCSAGGWYTDGSNFRQAFVVSQVNGTWQTAVEVPGTAVLNMGGYAVVNSVSCAPAGNCSAGGLYQDSSGHLQAFVVSQVNRTWQTAVEVPGTAALNTGDDASVSSVSCVSADNCGAGGWYSTSPGHRQPMVVSQVNGTWQTAVEVPGTAALNAGGDALVGSVSCVSAGNCSAGGWYTDSSGHQQAFVASQVNGATHPAVEVPGTAALNTGGRAAINSVSCVSAGNCSAVGNYTDSSGHYQASMVSEVNGTWQRAVEVPGAAALNGGGDAVLVSVSCVSADNCSAGGWYTDSSGHIQAMLVSQLNGTLYPAEEVPGTATLNAGGWAWIGSVSCGSAGNCSAGGFYEDSSGHQQAFVVSGS